MSILNSEAMLFDLIMRAAYIAVLCLTAASLSGTGLVDVLYWDMTFSISESTVTTVPFVRGIP
jgi:hypothetical protein